MKKLHFILILGALLLISCKKEKVEITNHQEGSDVALTIHAIEGEGQATVEVSYNITNGDEFAEPIPNDGTETLTLVAGEQKGVSFKTDMKFTSISVKYTITGTLTMYHKLLYDDLNQAKEMDNRSFTDESTTIVYTF